MKKEVKIIFHIDLNAFFASCAMIKEPYLKDKTFVVGGNTTMRRGVISTASYEARKLGIHSAMNINDALRIYPKLIVVPLNFSLYKKYSNIFFQFLKQYTGLILEGSIDEAYLDLTERSKHKHPLELAQEIQTNLLDYHQLPCSIGIGPTLFLAKMASDMKKPLGITVLRKKDIVSKLFPLPIRDCFGIGKKTYPKLEALGIHTIGDFTKLAYQSQILEVMSASAYQSYLDHILGRTSDVVDPKKYQIPKSISNETTLNYPMDQADAVFKIVTEMLDVALMRLEKEELVTKTIGIKIKNSDFETMNRGITLSDYTDDYQMIFDTVENLFELNYDHKPVRLVGVFLSSVLQKKDLKLEFNLFNYQEITRREALLYQKKTS